MRGILVVVPIHVWLLPSWSLSMLAAARLTRQALTPESLFPGNCSIGAPLSQDSEKTAPGSGYKAKEMRERRVDV